MSQIKKKILRRPKELVVDAKVTHEGVAIIVNKKSYLIKYPLEIWKKFDSKLKEILKDNLAYSATLFLPQILNVSEIKYRTARPLSETFLFKNGIYDMTSSAEEDGKSSKDYIQRFFNTRYVFADETVKAPTNINFARKKNNKVVIPFSFGKESLLSFALARELGLMPILVSVVEPSHVHEYKHRKKLIQEFEREYKTKVYIVENNPGGITKSGRAWGIPTELGYGLQATEYAMMALPFAYYFDAYYLTLGNEQSCHDFYIDSEGYINYRSAYDQFREWTSQQGTLLSLLLGKKIHVMSLVEPLFEIAEIKVLHTRYPEIGKYQMSCFAISQDARHNRWCQNCYKCAFMYPLFMAAGVDVARLGFSENLLDKKHQKHYESLFARRGGKYYYGRQDELILGVYMAALKGSEGSTIDKFKKLLWPYVTKNKKRIVKEYMGIHPTYNIPDEFKDKIYAIYNKELKKYNQ